MDNVKKASGYFIEISGRCQGKCPYCAQRRMRRGKHYGKFMSPALFEEILNHLLNINIIDTNIDDAIRLFNWGDPLLNENLNSILKILGDKGLYANISSNFMAKPNIENDLLSIIKYVTFSLSGFNQESYGKIHGGRFDDVIHNFEEFYARIRKYSLGTKIKISWHRYLFNEDEFWLAYRYFNRVGIEFKPIIAFYADIIEFIEFLEGNLSDEWRKGIENNIFLKHILERISYHNKKSKDFQCPEWDRLVIDETGNLLLCCCVTSYDSEHVLGNVLQLSAEDIWKKKLSDNLCHKCISSGVARWLSNQDCGGFHDIPWPYQDSLSYLKLWCQCGMLSSVAKLIGGLPYGNMMMKIIRRIRNQRRNFYLEKGRSTDLQKIKMDEKK